MDYESYLSEQETAGESQPELKGAKRRGLWDLLSTMKFAIWILVALGALSVVSMFAGELLPREEMARQGGGLGRALLDLFQMHDPFRSWWYRLLLGVLCLSLVACILERLPIIWRLWTKQPPQDRRLAAQHSPRHRTQRRRAPRRPGAPSPRLELAAEDRHALDRRTWPRSPCGVRCSRIPACCCSASARWSVPSAALPNARAASPAIPWASRASRSSCASTASASTTIRFSPASGCRWMASGWAASKRSSPTAVGSCARWRSATTKAKSSPSMPGASATASAMTWTAPISSAIPAT